MKAANPRSLRFSGAESRFKSVTISGPGAEDINWVSLGQNQCLPPDRQQAMQSSEMPGPGFHDFSCVGKFFSNFGRQILEKDDERKLNNMKTKIISKILLSLGLVFVLVGAITQVHGDSPAIPIVTINSTGDVPRGKTGSFVLDMKPPLTFGGTYVNFSVSGTAVPGVDYVSLVSPTYVGSSGYGVILVETLPDPRGSSFRRAYSVVVTLEPGLGYTIGEPKSAKMMIKP